MRIITSLLLDEVSAQAAAAPRRRKNHNLHPSDDFCCHRLLNAIEPGSYIQPHRHLDPLKDESMVVLRGLLGVVSFDGEGNVTGTRVLRPGGEAVAVDIPHGEFHTVLGLAAGTVFFEAKAGPYLPLTAAEKAPWAPAEGDEAAPAYLDSLAALFRSS
ncbi:WbuC family cupin fold metalloprotein [Geobacter sp.]|uniref:WbuC family cupin fold metalloprotein n=1 Tax=Geobacter sp. TaxID=46610 RepID=UPI00260EC4D5|nr:WbuC family cupin fold metalloprotein [Geobacter sp.]